MFSFTTSKFGKLCIIYNHKANNTSAEAFYSNSIKLRSCGKAIINKQTKQYHLNHHASLRCYSSVCWSKVHDQSHGSSISNSKQPQSCLYQQYTEVSVVLSILHCYPLTTGNCCIVIVILDFSHLQYRVVLVDCQKLSL